jgi:hypothetical protein
VGSIPIHLRQTGGLAARIELAQETMRQRIAQPPINPQQRDREHHDFWLGFVLALIGVIVCFCGLRNLTGVETTDGDSASELQLVKAFSSGGLELTDLAAPPRLEAQGDPAANAEAMERWERNAARSGPNRWKVRVNTGANTPCPT